MSEVQSKKRDSDTEKNSNLNVESQPGESNSIGDSKNVSKVSDVRSTDKAKNNPDTFEDLQDENKEVGPDQDQSELVNSGEVVDEKSQKSVKEDDGNLNE